MRIIMWNLMTLDGYFEGPQKWDLRWHQTVWGDELESLSIQQLKSASMLLFGRVTYDGMATYWSSPQEEAGEVADLMNTIPKVVFSNTIDGATWNNTRLVTGKAQDEIRRLKSGSDGSAFIFGSANLCDSLARQDLIDEYRIGLVPIVLGEGSPLFKLRPDQLRLRLMEANPLGTGCVILRYEPLAEVLA